ncbi:hypothetical protein LTR84_012787 [Exophiala bonariae]|uniref:BTB domain-containing protein n=1 Tax=Exophiala bonariae TaxID=1690606 RepID=A0AAV9NFB8_9EURO|nr:hypothetical protein LTR84_012787 [Exophiala bonariae]
MAPKLHNSQKARPNVLPVLPDPSRLFRARGGKKAESTSEQTDGAGETRDTPSSVGETAINELSSEVGTEKDISSNPDSVEEKAVSASTASQASTPSVSTPATQELAAGVPNYPLDHDKEVVIEQAELEASQEVHNQPSPEGTVTSAAETSVDTAQMAPVKVPEPEPDMENRLESPYDHIDRSRSTSAIVEDEPQPLAPSSATSVAAETEDKASIQVPSAMPQVSQPTNQALVTSDQSEYNGFHRYGGAVMHNQGMTIPTSSPRINTLPSLNEYFLHVAASKENADWIIQVHIPGNKAQSFPTYAHSILLLRSHRLRRLVIRQSSYGSNIIDLYPPRHVSSHAFESALRFLYSDAIIAKDFFLQQPPAVDPQATRLNNLEYILSYWIAGVELGLDTITERAEGLLSDYLDWDLLEPAYKAADEITKSEISSNSKHMTGTDYFVLSSSIIRAVLHFLVGRLDVARFKIDKNATSTLLSSRLPPVDDHRPRTNPALSSMVFGSMPSSAGVSPSSPQSGFSTTRFTPRETLATNIILSLDFENLHRFNTFLQRQGPEHANRVMTEVVKEREARRERVLNAQHASNAERMATSAKWDVVGHQEIFENGRLSEKRVGFLLPSSK